jgi:hypothetical protein
MPKLRFDAQDLRLDLPTSGWYPARIEGAHFRRSASGNRMLQVVYGLAEVEARYARICEYFVLEGCSAFGRALTWRRLIALYRAAGREPLAGDELDTGDLVGCNVEVEVEHDRWQGEPRLKVVGHRPADAAGSAGVPF